MKEPFVAQGMSTKKIFDDMYLYLREVNKKHVTLVSSLNVDEMNGLPVESYSEFTSRFWNLIYRDPYHGEISDEDKKLYAGPDILSIDAEIYGRKAYLNSLQP